jgi:hypothetical protein
MNYKPSFYRLNSLQQFDRLCLRKVTNTTRENCSGIDVLPPKMFFNKRLQVLETIFWRVTGRQNLAEGVGKLWRSLTEQDEQPGENYCGIVTGVRTAGTEILSGGVLEIGQVTRCSCVRLCCHSYHTAEILGFVNRLTQLLTVFRRVRKIAKSVISVPPCVAQHGTTRLPLDEFLWNLIIFDDFSKICRENWFHGNGTRITDILH